jgi:hypothetical protein
MNVSMLKNIIRKGNKIGKIRKEEKIGDKVSPGRKSYFGNSLRKFGKNGHLNHNTMKDVI